MVQLHGCVDEKNNILQIVIESACFESLLQVSAMMSDITDSASIGYMHSTLYLQSLCDGRQESINLETETTKQVLTQLLYDCMHTSFKVTTSSKRDVVCLSTELSCD